MSWQDEAKDDIEQWKLVMPKDADNNPIDWDWVRALDLSGGIGSLASELTSLQTSPPQSASDAFTVLASLPPQQLHDALKADYAIREQLEAIIAQCNTAFMMDFDRLLDSYRLPRALAYANRRLNDEIDMLLDAGQAHGLWNVTYKRQGKGTAAVLTAPQGAAQTHSGQDVLDTGLNGDSGGELNATASVNLDDLKDRTAQILAARAERRKNERQQRYDSENLVSRANLSGVIAPGSERSQYSEKSAPKPDWRNVYLPGRDIDTVMGIDIETTGTDPARVYIIDVGFEYMNMASPKPSNAPAGCDYEQPDYEPGDAYGQSRLSFGVPEANARHGNSFILELTGIDVRERGAQSGLKPFDEWSEAQAGLLQRLVRQPYVAHNAAFEHSFFMLNVAGYAEAYRAGNITIVDTMPMSRQWDSGSKPSAARPFGDNTLDAYAKRQGALAPSQSERHLGLEDAHIMLVAMKHHLHTLREESRGPWGPSGLSGIGGKRCGRR